MKNELGKSLKRLLYPNIRKRELPGSPLFLLWPLVMSPLSRSLWNSLVGITKGAVREK